MSKFSLSFLLVLILSLLLMGEARAATSCRITGVGNVNFGVYDPFAASPNDSGQGSVSVGCDSNPWTTFTVSIGPGSAGVFTPWRTMEHVTTGEPMNYNLYTSSARTTIWGDGTQGTSTVSGSSKKNNPRTLQIYGRIPIAQDVRNGNFSDVLVITVNW